MVHSCLTERYIAIEKGIHVDEEMLKIWKIIQNSLYVTIAAVFVGQDSEKKAQILNGCSNMVEGWVISFLLLNIFVLQLKKKQARFWLITGILF